MINTETKEFYLFGKYKTQLEVTNIYWKDGGSVELTVNGEDFLICYNIKDKDIIDLNKHHKEEFENCNTVEEFVTFVRKYIPDFKANLITPL